MKGPKVPSHVHKYYRTFIGGRKVAIDSEGNRRLTNEGRYEVFKCAIPGCPTFKERQLVIGDRSICWKCGEEIILTTENTRSRKPIHDWCKKMRVRVA